MPDFSPPAALQGVLVPRNASLAGWSALVKAWSLNAPLRSFSCVSPGFVRGSIRHQDEWVIYDKRFKPEDSLNGHLAFALRHEPMDLLILKRLFQAVPKHEIETLVNSASTGAIARRVWFFYEWLTGDRLNRPDAEAGNYVDALDPKLYFTTTPVNSTRHRVRDNLLGVPEFCPVIRRTAALNEFVGSRWDTQAKDLVGRISKGIVARAASFMLLADSQASYRIEGESPPRNRIERWGRAVAQAGKRPLSEDELARLQHIIVEDNRFVRPGLRTEGGFIGDRDIDNNPLPEFISARHQDLPQLIAGLLAANARMGQDLGVDAVVQAAATAFGFVFIHPFEDGNGRLHRYLIHHVLADKGFTPPGMIFPVSSVLLERMDDYHEALQHHSSAVMPFIEWRPTASLNVEVVNETADLYRYFDATEVAQLLYECVQRTIEDDLPRELAYLRSYDEAKRRIQEVVEMPDRTLGLLITFVSQNNGKLSKKRRRSDFAALTDTEVSEIEQIVTDAFASYHDEFGPSDPTP
jgi:hypothetical protein